jgi:hypothetical protein
VQIPFQSGIFLGMPLFWLAPMPEPFLHTLLQSVEPAEIADDTKETVIDEELRVTYHGIKYVNTDQTTEFTGGVVARFGPTVLRSDYLMIRRGGDEPRAVARGNVRLEDPDGTASAEEMEFDWRPDSRRVWVKKARIDFAGVTLRVGSAELAPDQWSFRDAYGTNCPSSKPLYSLESDAVIVRPGRSGQIVRPTIRVFGAKLVTVPSFRFNLDRRTEGIRLPQIVYRREAGLGVAWDLGALSGPNSAVSASAQWFQGGQASYGGQYSWSGLDANDLASLIRPRSDLAERLDYAYMENIFQESPQGERSVLGTRRRSAGAGSYFFQGAANQQEGKSYSKPVDLVAEQSGRTGTLNVMGQVRAQAIRRELEPNHYRAVLSLSAAPDPIPAAKNLLLHGRVDFGAFVGRNSSGFVYGSAGLTYQPIPEISLAAAYVHGTDFGDAAFPIDVLGLRSGVRLRTDLSLGPTRLSYLWRYDSKLGWFDKQYYFSQIVGCLQPYVVYRESKSDFQFGVNLRIARFQNIISSRTYQRGDVRTTLSGPGRQPRD